METVLLSVRTEKLTEIAGTIASMVDKSQESRVKYDLRGTALKIRSSAAHAAI